MKEYLPGGLNMEQPFTECADLIGSGPIGYIIVDKKYHPCSINDSIHVMIGTAGSKSHKMNRGNHE